MAARTATYVDDGLETVIAASSPMAAAVSPLADMESPEAFVTLSVSRLRAGADGAMPSMFSSGPAMAEIAVGVAAGGLGFAEPVSAITAATELTRLSKETGSRALAIAEPILAPVIADVSAGVAEDGYETAREAIAAAMDGVVAARLPEAVETTVIP